MLVTKKEVIGSIAKWAIRQAPYALPWEFKETLDDIDTAIELGWKKDIAAGVSYVIGTNFYHFDNPEELYSRLHDILMGVDRFCNWNLSLVEIEQGISWKDEHREKNPILGIPQNKDLIDLQALLRNISNSLKAEQFQLRGELVEPFHATSNKLTPEQLNEIRKAIRSAPLEVAPRLLQDKAWYSTNFEFHCKNGVDMMSAINELVQSDQIESDLISDGYHTFSELYEHRITLYIVLCRLVAHSPAYQLNFPVWRSKLHSDGSSFEGWFVLGLNKEPGEQITYHLPISKWEDTWFADTLPKAPCFDNHTSAQVLERLKKHII